MADETNGARNIEDLVSQIRSGQLSRRNFIAALAALGVTVGGATAILVSTRQRDAIEKGNAPGGRGAIPTPTEHIESHDKHLNAQLKGDVPSMTSDYAANAVVEDPLFTAPFVGLAAIAHRYASEVASVPDRALRVLNRVVAGEQLIVEWEATGTHQNSFLGFGGTGRPYVLRGTTVVTRRDGKIVREAHYYDVDYLRRQVEG